MNPSPLEKFNRWFVVPFDRLRNCIPNGDGAFAALSIGFMLCERFHRIETSTQDCFHDQESFKDYAAFHFDLETTFFVDFWDVFRNGLNHQGSPKWRFGNKNRAPYLWAIGERGFFKHYPTLALNSEGNEVICLDPWAFTSHYINLFLENPALLEMAVHHCFGDVVESDNLRSEVLLTRAGLPRKDIRPCPTCATLLKNRRDKT